MNCFRYLGFKSLAEVDRMTLREYELLMEAERLKQIDLDYRCHLLAWLTFKARAMKKTGKNKSKPVFAKFKKFYNYENEIEKAKSRVNEKGRFSGIGKFLR